MSRKEMFIGVAAFVLFTFILYMQMSFGNAGDKNWMLMVAHMLLNGSKLYRDILEVNPPFIFWFYTIPSWLAFHSHLFEDYQMLVLLGIVATILVIALCLHIIRVHPLFAHDTRRQTWFAALLYFVFIFQTSPAYFFDREHIFLVLTFPYVLLLIPHLPCASFSRALRFLIGLIAGIGFCIKPYSLILFLGLQGVYIHRERSARILLSTENIVIYMVGAFYLLMVWKCTPQYITLILPMATATYASYVSKAQGFSFFGVIALLIFGVTFVDFRPRFHSPYRTYIYYFTAVCFLWLCYALVNNGWGYTYNPLSSMLLITACFMLWHHQHLKEQHRAHGLAFRRFSQGAHACMLVLAGNALLIMATFFVTSSFHCEAHRGCRDMQKFEGQIAASPNHTFGALIMDFNLLPEIHRLTSAELVTRFNIIWMLPSLLSSDPVLLKRHQWIKDYMTQGMAEDLDSNRPGMVLVDTSPEFPDIRLKHMDMLAWFSADAAFKKAWSHYRYQSEIDRCRPPDVLVQCRFTLYQRTP